MDRRPIPPALVAVVVLLAALPVLAAPAPAAGGSRPPQSTVEYSPPTDAPVTDPFRPPTNPFGAGNRGLEYGTSAGDAIRASASGVVVFAGQVGGALHVTIRHDDGLRTSYSFLATIVVRAGDRVDRGALVGTAGGPFHFGVRDAGDNYLDPQLLFAGRLHLEVHLVPGPDDGDGHPRTRASEIGALQGVVRDRLAQAVAFGRRIAADVVATSRMRIRAVSNLTGPSHLASVARSMQAWYLQRDRCTPPAVSPPRPARRRIAILVGGVGSSSDFAAIDEVDTQALGYDPADVIRFSYRGGRTPKPLPAGSALAALPATTYSPADTEADLEQSAARLQELLRSVATADPGVPIDVLAHSQGGIIGRLAIAVVPPPGELQTLVTLGVPHRGANLATAIGAADRDPWLNATLVAAHDAGRFDLDPDARSIAELAESSPLIDRLGHLPSPGSVRVVSIGASGDLTVPAPRTLLGDGSSSTVISLGGLDVHGDLPGSAPARREIALAIAGLPPTCRPFAPALRDTISAETIDALEDDLTATAAWAPLLLGPPPH